MLRDQNVKLVGFKAIFDEKDEFIKDKMEKVRREGGNNLSTIVLELKKCQNDIQQQMEDVYDIQDEINKVREDLNDCEVPSNIGKRKNELKQLEERLVPVHNEFIDLKTTAEELFSSGNRDSNLRQLISEIENEFKNIDKERAYLLKFLNTRLIERYTPKDFKCENAQSPISEVRQLKNLIKSTNTNIDNISNLIANLGGGIITADLKNGTSVMEKKAASLFERLKNVKSQLRKIDDCTKDMDGDGSGAEEEDFIEALREEMPDVMARINDSFESIDDFNGCIKKLRKNPTHADMQKLKNALEEVSQSIKN